ncbi:hypothetical protein FGO68_gene3481 [Halteria grandinella]|uniref:Uncharacterized protein n=1 Tax=Halteria grandinella TaxID=5974 RepID=A0A8J8T565_HALGN|nr:hypothetical protein FGO68_gene3481 [Halteria grandinella]
MCIIMLQLWQCVYFTADPSISSPPISVSKRQPIIVSGKLIFLVHLFEVDGFTQQKVSIQLGMGNWRDTCPDGIHIKLQFEAADETDDEAFKETRSDDQGAGKLNHTSGRVCVSSIYLMRYLQR